MKGWFLSLALTFSLFGSEEGGRVLQTYPDGKERVLLYFLLSEEGEELLQREVLLSPSGQKERETELLPNGLPHGMRTIYSKEERVVGYIPYVKGKREGEEQHFYENGSLCRRQNWKDGVPEGSHILYFPTGEIEQITHYLHGKRQGKSFSYYQNGQKREEIDYLKDVPHGEKKVWNEKGELIERVFLFLGSLHNSSHQPAETLYGNQKRPLRIRQALWGKRSGSEISYFPSGEKRREQCYQRGKRGGEELFFDREGEIVARRESLDDFDEQNDFQREGIYLKKNQSGVVLSFWQFARDHLEGMQREYFPSGKLKRAIHYSAGKREGEERIWSEEGTLLHQRNYRKDLLEGEESCWFPNGQLCWQRHYSDGIPEGEQIFYREDGSCKEQIFFSRGAFQGQQWSYHPNGIARSLLTYSRGCLEGKQREWNAAGILVGESNYHRGKRKGLYWFQDEEQEYFFYYIKGRREGWQSSFAIDPVSRKRKLSQLSYFFQGTLRDLNQEQSFSGEVA